jgi:hypothetical protein
MGRGCWVRRTHAVVYFIWLVAVTARISLVEVRNVAFHRRTRSVESGPSGATLTLGSLD